MKYNIQDHLLQVLKNVPLNLTLKNKFLLRCQEGNLTRDENPFSHLCIYFAAYDPTHKRVFMGEHIKSGLWLFNGGHIDKYETLEEALYREMNEEWGVIQKTNIQFPSLFTLTEINNPKKQICKWHYDLWYMIPFDKKKFHPNEKFLAKEFYKWGWKTINVAKLLTQDKATLQGIDYIDNLLLNSP